MDGYEALKRLGEVLHADRAAGRLAALPEYVRRYSGREERVAREYALVAVWSSTSSGSINLEWLTEPAVFDAIPRQPRACSTAHGGVRGAHARIESRAMCTDRSGLRFSSG